MLLAVGLPPVTANASNTVGMVGAGVGGSFGYRHELRLHPRLTLVVLASCAAGSVLGATLLLALPPGVFEAVVPWLILGTSVLVGVQPRISRRVRARHVGAADRVEMSRTTLGFSALTGVYGGYFGAGSGVMMVAVLGFGLDLPFTVVNALKTLAIMSANVVATLVFLVFAPLDWPVIVLLAAGSVVGGLPRRPRRPPAARRGLPHAGRPGRRHGWRAAARALAARHPTGQADRRRGPHPEHERLRPRAQPGLERGHPLVDLAHQVRAGAAPAGHLVEDVGVQRESWPGRRGPRAGTRPPRRTPSGRAPA